jgi:hypothetical protein
VKELPIPPGTDLSKVPEDEVPYLRRDGDTQVSNLQGRLVKLVGTVKGCRGFSNKKFDHYLVVCCPIQAWEFIFGRKETTSRRKIIEDLLVAGYSVEIQHTQQNVHPVHY